ncbi:hypothetical protein FLL45_10325 [Aliikangiella marina]|uniref:Uncharacterized protein n=1 Tax=Aliikangiella marina TaxID=1712262 RepID=A0A545TDP0_9GAMM|nr:hypothetical protein [Aliikangiella marina]TQV75320.1 hypothetical protein FLL45_10325 [Aliikangiella marina]
MPKKRNKRVKSKASQKSLHKKARGGLQVTSGSEFVLETFEGYVYGGKHTQALGYLLNLLGTFEEFMLIQHKEEPYQLFQLRKQRWSTRLASACCALFVNPNWNFDDEQYFYLSRFHDWYGKIFELSQAGDSNYVLDLINSTKYRSDEQMLKRFYLHLTLNSPVEIYRMLNLNRDLALPIILSLVGDSCTLITRHEDNRSVLIQNFDALTSESNLHQQYLGAIHKSWMLCSYAIDDRKHLVKLGINKLIRKLLSFVKESSLATKKTIRPSIAVLIEVCRTSHVMYRCYGDRIKSLRETFDVTIYANKDDIDETVAGLADSVVYVDINSESIQAVADKIRTADHDIIYYPSLGMANWTVFTANLRLAPVQCMSLGHPATSCSSQMDFVIHPKDVLADPYCFTEKVVVGDFTPNYIAPKIDEEIEFMETNDDIVRVAIVSKYMKINLLMIEVCKELLKHCKAKIEFHFFPDTKGLLLDYITQIVKSELPASGVFPTMSYKNYMQFLSRCDLRIGTFPFSGTNTTIDCFSMGVPTIAFDGPEVSSHFDSVVINRHCPEVHDDLVASTVEDLISKCVRMIDDEAFRLQISEKIKSIDIDKTIFKSTSSNSQTQFADTILWAYQNIEEIRNSSEQVFEADLGPTLEKIAP